MRTVFVALTWAVDVLISYSKRLQEVQRQNFVLQHCLQVYPEMGEKTRRTWHTDNNLFGKAGDDMEKVALFSP